METGEPPVESDGMTVVPATFRARRFAAGPGSGKELCLEVAPPSACGHQEDRYSTQGEQGSPKAFHPCSFPRSFLSPRYVGSFRRPFRGDSVTRSADSSSEPGRTPIPLRGTGHLRERRCG
jgi:hypothetical protein